MPIYFLPIHDSAQNEFHRTDFHHMHFCDILSFSLQTKRFDNTVTLNK